MVEFKVGDKVKLNEFGGKRYGYGYANPSNKIGVIVSVYDELNFEEEFDPLVPGVDEDFIYGVSWGEGNTNCYQAGTLSLAKRKLEMLENE